MRLHTFYTFVDGIDQHDELRLIQQWQQHHERLGFETMVLQEFHAKQHPFYEDMLKAVRDFPSVNPKGYDTACYLRWLACATAQDMGQIIMMDYDLFLLPTVWDDLNPLLAPTGKEMQKLRVFQHHIPSLVSGSYDQYLAWCERFAEYKPETHHTSDMCIMEQWHMKDPQCFTALPFVKLYTEQGWESAPAVHYSNSTMQPNKKVPRWKHVLNLRLPNYEPNR